MIELEPLRTSFDKIIESDLDFATLFYKHLFEAGPELRQYFENVDMTSQGAMVAQAVQIALRDLDKMEKLQVTLDSLGRRHANYGVNAEHYEFAVKAFVETLREILADDFDAALEENWREALATITSSMNEGGRQFADNRAARKRPSDDDGNGDPPLDPYTARFMPADVDRQMELYADADTVDLPKSIAVEYAGEKVASAAPLQTILDVSLQNGIAHVCVCGRIGKCSTCRVAILDGLGNCLPRNQTETRMAKLKGFPPELRLACQTRIVGPVKLKRLVRDEADIREAASVERDQVGREMALAVLFADIRGFTAFSENNLAYDTVHALNRYFDVVGGAIDRNEGFIDKYIGDGVMALFGLNSDREVHPCVDAVKAALDALAGLESVNEYLKNHLGHEFKIVIGIHYGPTIVGEVGYSQRRQFTAIGDVVNTAARLESEAKIQGASILVSDVVREKLPRGLCRYGSSYQLSLKGKSRKQTAFEILAAR